MGKLWLGVVLFVGPHLFSTLLPGLRDQLKEKFHPGPWRGLYSVITLVGLVLLIMAYRDPATAANLYDPAPWAKHATMLLVLIGFILIAASHGKGYIKKFVKHPMSLGVAFWSVGHLLANGETSVVVIFASLLAIALFDIVFSLARGKVAVFEPRLRSDITAVVGGALVYGVLLFGFHPYVLQVPVV